MKRIVGSLIRFIAAGMILLGITGISLGCFHRRVQKPGLSSIIIGAIVMLLGILLLALSGKITEKLTQNFDE